MNYLKAALLGLDNGGACVLEAASTINCLQIQAVADKDTNLAEEFARKYNCAAYDDYRQLIIQNQFDCLVVAAGMHSCYEYVRMAMKKKFNILKLAPIGRNFEEAAELVRLAEEENIKFAVANPGRFAPSFLAFREFLRQSQDIKPFLLTAECMFGNQEYPAWHTDPKLAGGGVLLHNCYQIIDQIIWNFSVPQQVYCLNTNSAADRQQRLYLTEDTAIVTMKFHDIFFANLTASKSTGAGQEFLKLYCKDKILTVGNSLFTISNHLGRVGRKSKYEKQGLFLMTKILENFALSVLLPDKNKLCSSASENLRNMAVIEAAYLSGRTGMPEEPNRILKMAQLEHTDIRPEHK